MMNVGKNAPRVIERRTEVKAPELVEGDNVRIEQDGDVLRVHAKHDHKLKDEVVRLQQLLALFSEKQIAADDKARELHQLMSDQCLLNSEVVVDLRKQIAALAERPAQLVETKIIERPGMTMHELRVEYKTPRWVWVMLAILLANSLYMWVR